MNYWQFYATSFGMMLALIPFVNLAMAPRPVGEVKLKLSSEEIDEQHSRHDVARRLEASRLQLRSNVRKSFVLILFATIAITIFWHRYGIFNGAFTVVHHMSAKIKTVGTSTQLQQQTAGYEQEVNEIAQSDTPSK